MRIVGEHLANEATNRGVSDERDLFGRSAFNRYYYAAFLAVRAVLRKIEPSWATPTHQGVPVVLKGDVLRRIKKQIRDSEKSGIITHSQGEQYYRAAATAALELSNLLTSARETRRIADYEPETKISDDGKVMKLGAYSLEAAKSWENRVHAHAGTILNIYDQLGLI
jgi:uncharacterized protein (UPF0332 family)